MIKDNPDYYDFSNKQLNLEELRSYDVFSAYVDWLTYAKEWTTFLTLTFRNETYPDIAFNRWRSLVRTLNTDLLGHRYVRKVKHSYFSYVLSREYQVRGVIHFHVLIDRPVDYALIHRTWSYMAGYAHASKVKTPSSVIAYALKYAVKSGDVEVYLTDKEYQPKQYPTWWRVGIEDQVTAERLNNI